MPNRPARFTTAELRRALKAAEQVGHEWFVDVLPDGRSGSCGVRLRSLRAQGTRRAVVDARNPGSCRLWFALHQTECPKACI